MYQYSRHKRWNAASAQQTAQLKNFCMQVQSKKQLTGSVEAESTYRLTSFNHHRSSDKLGIKLLTALVLVGLAILGTLIRADYASVSAASFFPDPTINPASDYYVPPSAYGIDPAEVYRYITPEDIGLVPTERVPMCGLQGYNCVFKPDANGVSKVYMNSMRGDLSNGIFGFIKGLKQLCLEAGAKEMLLEANVVEETGKLKNALIKRYGGIEGPDKVLRVRLPLGQPGGNPSTPLSLEVQPSKSLPEGGGGLGASRSGSRLNMGMGAGVNLLFGVADALHVQNQAMNNPTLTNTNPAGRWFEQVNQNFNQMINDSRCQVEGTCRVWSDPI
jgi:hypothetical protein